MAKTDLFILGCDVHVSMIVIYYTSRALPEVVIQTSSVKYSPIIFSYWPQIYCKLQWSRTPIIVPGAIWDFIIHEGGVLYFFILPSDIKMLNSFIHTPPSTPGSLHSPVICIGNINIHFDWLSIRDQGIINIHIDWLSIRDQGNMKTYIAWLSIRDQGNIKIHIDRLPIRDRGNMKTYIAWLSIRESL